MPDKRWKAAEREVARYLGIKDGRTGPVGKNVPDAIGDWLSVEVKSNQAFPKWLLDAMRQTRVNAMVHAPGTLPLLVLHQVGDNYADALVILTAEAFVEWFGTDEVPALQREPGSTSSDN